MDRKMVFWIVIILLIGIIIGYLVLPNLMQSASGIGENVFGASKQVSPPTLPP